MRKILLGIIFIITSSIFSLHAQTLVLGNDGVLMIKQQGIPDKIFQGDRQQLMTCKTTSPKQPSDKNLAILNEDGTGGCYGHDNQTVFIQSSGGFWKSIYHHVCTYGDKGWITIKDVHLSLDGTLVIMTTE